MQIFEEGEGPASAGYVIQIRYPRQEEQFAADIQADWFSPQSSMSIPRGSLRAFLASAKKTLQNAIINQQRVTLVIGNESCDLDSITSAIVLAYFRSTSVVTPLTNPSTNRHIPPSQYPPLYIPILNIPREDIRIRPELQALLPHANLDTSHLITLDDLTVDPPAGLDPSGRDRLQPEFTHLLLVDHNVLAGPLAERGFGSRVVGCIDHHVDEKLVPPDTGNEPRIIEKCGSCTSLVIRYCQPAWDALSDSASTAGRAISGQSDTGVGSDDEAVRRTWDAQIAKLAIASVLIDTTELKDESKTTEVDQKAVDYLESKIFLAPAGIGAQWNRHKFYKEINHAKKDLSLLTPMEILRKDYKYWDVSGKALGISSATSTIKWQVEKAGGAAEMRDVIKNFSKTRKLDIFSIMAHSKGDNNQDQREILMWAINPKYNLMLEEFEKQKGEYLGLAAWKEVDGLEDDNEPGFGRMRIWWQTETQYSRKLVSPLMREILEKI